MYKLIQTLRSLCIICWAAAFIIAIMKPEMNFRVIFMIAAGVLVFQNLSDFIVESEEHARKIKGSNDKP